MRFHILNAASRVDGKPRPRNGPHTLRRTALTGPDADATQARESVRALIDKIVITPVGEETNRRKQGVISIEITGRWANLVGLAEPGSSHRVQLATDNRSQLNPTNTIWRIETTISPIWRNRWGYDVPSKRTVEQPYQGATGSGTGR